MRVVNEYEVESAQCGRLWFEGRVSIHPCPHPEALLKPAFPKGGWSHLLGAEGRDEVCRLPGERHTGKGQGFPNKTLTATGWVCRPHRNLQGPNAMSEGSHPGGCRCSSWSGEGTELSSFVRFASTSHKMLITVTKEVKS